MEHHELESGMGCTEHKHKLHKNPHIMPIINHSQTCNLMNDSAKPVIEEGIVNWTKNYESSSA